MWRRLTNGLRSLHTYAEMSPDLGLRRRINQVLRSRPSLNLEEWYVTFWQPLCISREVATFVYEHLEDYSGLQFAHVVPRDRLRDDLQFPSVCWFDWERILCDDFYDRFGIDISEQWDSRILSTVEDLILFLNRQLRSAHHRA